MPNTLLVAPAARSVGLTTACLGLIRALDRGGVRVAFAKPIADRGEDSASLVRLGTRLEPPAPIERAAAEDLLASGEEQTLMEHVVALCGAAGEGAEVLVVEGMAAETGITWAARVNALVMRALDADLLLVSSPHARGPRELAGSVAIAARAHDLAGDRSVGCILNRVCTGPAAAHVDTDAEHHGPLCGDCAGCRHPPLEEVAIDAYGAALRAVRVRPVAMVPCSGELAAPRVRDVAAAMGATTLWRGDHATRRVRDVAICAAGTPGDLGALEPGTLLVTPGDRRDVLVAVSRASQAGTGLAGVLLAGGGVPGEDALGLCRGALDAGLPLLRVVDDVHRAAARVCATAPRIPADDAERVERAMTFVADRVDPAWVKELAAAQRVRRLSPPAFRQRLVEAARAANKRIVLPEGAEPRTVAAAARVAERRLARCILLARPEEVAEVARRLGVTLPPSVEIVDPAELAPRYVDPMFERRRDRGLTREQAAAELEDSIGVGTMMVALDEADGLVSGAVHTTAHTIRPALRIIKTVPGCNLVSSVFFMCLPDQVLVFGDCAVNPDPTAEQLADIAIQSAESASAFGIPPRVAMLSYSTGSSAGGEGVEKVKRATELARARRPDLPIDGPLQYDAAVVPAVARAKAPASPVAGRATVLVFPDLDAGNVTYKAVQRSANVVSMGPMLQGLVRPVNDLSRGCLVEDVVFTIALTAIQAEQAAARRARAAGPGPTSTRGTAAT